ncbi:MAG: Hpt domain-containing protein [Lachnospiraceae bacterium]|nr:Hpt domain-containing protein [Lachnospiraceae bacterium]
MDLKEFYTSINGDYEGVISRLRSEKMVRKFVLKFLNDSSYDNLVKSLEENNYEEAFRASHTIKGICQNLGFTVLGDSSSVLTDALRNGWSEGAEELVKKVKEDYRQTAEAVKALEAEG